MEEYDIIIYRDIRVSVLRSQEGNSGSVEALKARDSGGGYGLANLTEKAIKASALKLLNEKPMNQITVKDIVEDCGINRNSFYYHFRDLPSLIEEMVLEQAEFLIEQYPSINSLEECLDAAVSFAMNNRKAAMHIYNSVSRDIYEQYLWRVCEHVVTVYINSILKEYSINDFDRDVIINFYKCACFGQILDWQRGGMKSDIKKQFLRMCEIKKGIIEDIAARCAAPADKPEKGQ